jgi:hypothetical protein
MHKWILHSKDLRENIRIKADLIPVTSVADPGSGFRDPGSGSGMNFFRIPDSRCMFFWWDFLKNPCSLIFYL